MQCPSCEFYNMPGATACGRCGTTLAANSIAVDVHPPRAGAAAKRIRRWIPSPWAYGLRDEFHRTARQSRQAMVAWGFAAPPPGTVVRMPVPGWALGHVGRPRTGQLFAGAFVALLIPAIAFHGAMLGSLAMGLAFGVHVSSCLSVMRLNWTARGAAAISAIAIGLGLFLFPYLPAGLLLSRYITAVTIDYAAAPFAAGDVLLMNPRAYVSAAPRPGDVVMFRQSAQQTRLPGMGPAFVIREGQVIDRVLAEPGDEVKWEQGRLWVNGQESPLRPLNAAIVPDHLTWTVPEGHYLVLPTSSVAMNNRITPPVWQTLGLVPADAIESRVFLRTQPLSRWGRID
jgi:signal peptidase I